MWGQYGFGKGKTYFLWHMMTSSLLNSSPPSATFMLQWIGSALVQIMVCSLYGAKPLSKPFYCKCSEYKEIHLHFLFFLNTEMAQVIEILLCEGQEAVNLISQYHGCWWPGNVRTSAIIVLSQFAWYIPIWVPWSFTFPLKSYTEVMRSLFCFQTLSILCISCQSSPDFISLISSYSQPISWFW